MVFQAPNGQYYVSYGPNENCTLADCPVEASVYGYRPDIAASIASLILFSLALLLHVVQGVCFRTWFFMYAMVMGCVAELIGYVGRVMLYEDPFTFNGFMIQIVCITIGPVFYCAGIYVTLAKTVRYLGIEAARFRPELYYYVFLSCDIVSLVLQGTGGGMSTGSSGTSNIAVDVSLVGLCFQVFTLFVFCCLCVDYGLRWRKLRAAGGLRKQRQRLAPRFKVFISFLALAVVLIFIRCCYRIFELSQGYKGTAIQQQPPFIALETCMIIIAVFALLIAHPGPVFDEASSTSSKRGGHRAEKSVNDSDGYRSPA